MPPHIWTILAHFIHAPTENANHTFKVDGVRYLRAASTGIFFSPLKLFRHLPRFPLRRSPLAPRENLLPVCSVEGRERVSSLSHDREVNGVFSNMHYEPLARVIEMHVRASERRACEEGAPCPTLPHAAMLWDKCVLDF